MSFKMLGSDVTTMTAEGGSITGVPVSAGCQALETVHIPLLLSFRAPMQLNLICNHRLLWLLAVLLSVSEMLRVALASLQSARLGNELLKVCKKNDWQEAITLLEKGGHVNTRNEVASPLHCAAALFGNLKVTKLLIEKGEFTSYLNYMTSHQNTLE